MLGVRPELATLCPRKLKAGQIRRVPGRGPLVGFHIACPGCGFVAPYLREEGGFVELDDEVLVGVTRPPSCVRCRRRIEFRDGRLEAT